MSIAGSIFAYFNTTGEQGDYADYPNELSFGRAMAPDTLANREADASSIALFIIEFAAARLVKRLQRRRQTSGHQNKNYSAAAWAN